MNEPSVAVVIVNWNKKNCVLDLLNDLKSIEYTNHKVFLVDNASSDGSVEAVQESFPEVNILPQEENLGGTGGFNLGMKHVLDASGFDYIWLLDNDVKVDRSALARLVTALEDRLDAGIVGSLILNSANPSLVVAAGGFLNLSTVQPEDCEQNYIYVKGEELREVDYVPSCSLLVRTNLVQSLGIWDENIFVNWDDIEWCIRFKNAGHKVLVHRGSIVYHSAFFEKAFNPIVIYYQQRNRLYYALRYLPKMYRFKGLFHVLFSHFLQGKQSEVMGDGLYSEIINQVLRDVKEKRLGTYKGAEFKPIRKIGLTPWNVFKKKAKKRDFVILPYVKAEDFPNWISSLNAALPKNKIIFSMDEDRAKCFMGTDKKNLYASGKGKLKRISITLGKIAITSREPRKEEGLFPLRIIPFKDGVEVYTGNKAIWFYLLIRSYIKAEIETRKLLKNNPYKEQGLSLT